MNYNDLITELRNLAISYLEDKGGLDDEEKFRAEGEQDEIIQSIDTLCDYLESCEND